MRHELRQFAQRQHAVDQEHLVVGDARARAARSGAAPPASPLRFRGGSTEPRRRRLSAVSNSAHQVFGLFLDLDVAVADDAERALPLDRVAGKQLAAMNSPVACSSVIMRTVPPSAGAGRRMNRSIFCGTRISAFIALPSLVRASWKRDARSRDWE